MKATSFFKVGFSVVLAIIVSSIAVFPAAGEGKKGGTLVAVINHAPRHLNGAVQTGIATMMCSAQLFASPIMYDDKWKPHPYLAESWAFSDDGLSLTLKLVKGATFHDGKPITSEDMAFSIMTMKAKHPFRSMMEPVEKVDTPDAHTAVIRLAKPHPALLLAMSPPLCPIIPKHVFGDGQDIQTHPMNLAPVGSGPFKFVEFKAGEHLVLERYENFFIKDRPYLDRFILKIIPDSVNRLVSLEKGEAQMDVFLNNSSDIKQMSRLSGIKVNPMGEAIGGVFWLAFNTIRKPLDDKRVRQAISYCVDRDFLLNKLLLGVPKRATGPIDPSSPLYSADVQLYNIDLDKANKLLDEAGHPKGKDGTRFALTIDYTPAGPDWKTIAEYIKAQLKKIGIDGQIRQSPDFPTWAKWVSNFDFDLTLDSLWNWADPVIGAHRAYLTSNIRKGVIFSNTQSYSNPKVDELLNQAGSEMDPIKRKALYAEFQKIVVDDAPVTYILMTPFYVGYHQGLKNVCDTIWGTINPMHEVYWEAAPGK